MNVTGAGDKVLFFSLPPSALARKTSIVPNMHKCSSHQQVVIQVELGF
jgi:hypothetical protein